MVYNKMRIKSGECMVMKTTLIDLYLENITKEQRRKVLSVLEFIGRSLPDGVLSSVFTLPGYTVDGIPVCSLRAKGKRLTLRFFQKDVFAVFADRFSHLDVSACSVTFDEPEDIKIRATGELVRLTARTVRVDAAFLRSIRMRDYGYYDNVFLKPKKR